MFAQLLKDSPWPELSRFSQLREAHFERMHLSSRIGLALLPCTLTSLSLFGSDCVDLSPIHVCTRLQDLSLSKPSGVVIFPREPLVSLETLRYDPGYNTLDLNHPIFAIQIAEFLRGIAFSFPSLTLIVYPEVLDRLHTVARAVDSLCLDLPDLIRYVD